MLSGIAEMFEKQRKSSTLLRQGHLDWFCYSNLTYLYFLHLLIFAKQIAG
jgi:hypothetical protein